MSKLSGLRVISSSIHGYGVIATRRFSAGEIVCYGDGVLYREDEPFDDTYALIVESDDDDGPTVYWDLVDQTRWINHSCDSNSLVDAKFDDESKSVIAWWTATRDIEPGEEITYDYAFIGQLAEPCACGARNCRGLIVDLDELDGVPEHLRGRLRLAAKPRSADDVTLGPPA